ncbi:MAG: Flp family type IVb pilin [Alphaproteobacteria bacterium]|nr:Flp family type IVb pilin [Alphaproteobacteria bacterium]
MTKLWQRLSARIRNTSGVTAIEYGLIAGGIAVGIIALVVTVGGDLKSTFTTISGKVATIPK